MITIDEMYGKIACLFGYHAPAEHCGKVHIANIDYTLYPPRLTAGNIKACPRCGKTLEIDYLAPY